MTLNDLGRTKVEAGACDENALVQKMCIDSAFFKAGEIHCNSIG